MDACTWTKLQLNSGIDLTEFDDEVLEAAAALGIFNLPTGKTPVDVVSDYLRHVYQHAWKTVIGGSNSSDDQLPVEFWFTIPATWSDQARAATKEAAIRAGFGQRPQDKLFMIPEPEAAAQAVFKLAQHNLEVFLQAKLKENIS